MSCSVGAKTCDIWVYLFVPLVAAAPPPRFRTRGHGRVNLRLLIYCRSIPRHRLAAEHNRYSPWHLGRLNSGPLRRAPRSRGSLPSICVEAHPSPLRIFQRLSLASSVHFFASALNVSTVMPVRVARRIFSRSCVDSFAITSRSPDITVLKGSTFASSGLALTRAGTRSRQYTAWL